VRCEPKLEDNIIAYVPVAKQQISKAYQWINWEAMFSTLSEKQLRDATVEELLGEMFSVRYMPRCHKQDRSRARAEAGSSTSTVTLQVVGGDEKGSLKCETVKCGQESEGTRTQERLRWRGPVVYTKDRHFVSLQRPPHKNRTVIVKD
jgi:hypothetical protein